MKRYNLSENWEFYIAEEGNAFQFAPKTSQTVDLPHDFIRELPRDPSAPLGWDTAYSAQGEGVYRKKLEIPKDWNGRRFILEIGGAANQSEVSVNREVLVIHPNGTVPFLTDITGALRFNGRDNIIKIITQSRQPSCRWYTGGGLYRSVNLYVGGKISFLPWDIFVTTPIAEREYAAVHFSYILCGTEGMAERNHDLWIRASIMDAEGKIIQKTMTENRHECMMIVPAPKRWKIDDPYLYHWKLEAVQKKDDGSCCVLDEADGTFGIRSITVNAEEGFCLNHEPLKLKGGCLHSDNGLLGACSFEDAETRKIRILKNAGYNCVRSSHNPPSEALLNACDREGMLLLDEAFDAWVLGKRPLDYHLYFASNWEKDIEAMVKHARNHPCVIGYSIGNEINESNGTSNGPEWSGMLSDKIREMDSTHFVTSALCGVFPDLDDGVSFNNIDANTNLDTHRQFVEKTERYCRPLDVIGMNYLPDLYGRMHTEFPHAVLLGTESYAFNTHEYWREVREKPYVIGDFIWAAMDYLGEVGGGRVKWDTDANPQDLWNAPYPWRTSWQSDFDMTGDPRPQSVYRQIMWGKKDICGLFTEHPMHFGHQYFGTGWHWPDVHPTWTYPAGYIGKPVRVEIYGDGDEAVLYCNGQEKTKIRISDYRGSTALLYEPGNLDAVIFRDGRQVSKAHLETTGCFDHLETEAEPLYSEKGTLRYYRITAVDQNERRVYDAENCVTVFVKGGRLLAAGSGNPCSEDALTGPSFHLFHGRGLAVVQCKKNPQIQVSVQADKK